jgi:hypothetical protein
VTDHFGIWVQATLEGLWVRASYHERDYLSPFFGSCGLQVFFGLSLTFPFCHPWVFLLGFYFILFLFGIFF